MMVEGLGTNAVTAAGYSQMLGALNFADCIVALLAETQKVQGGNLAGLEGTLTAQVIALNAMFTQLAYQASKMTIVDQIDRFTRLAFKAQGQCRATVETLALMKNPPTVFARQANIANGPQQVNNSPVLAVPNDHKALARAGNPETQENRLLEEGHGERLDAGATSAPGTRHPALAPLGKVHRTPDR